MPQKSKYDARRARARERIKKHPTGNIMDFAEQVGRNYKYVADVLRGAPGKRSFPVIREAEDYVNRL